MNETEHVATSSALKEAPVPASLLAASVTSAEPYWLLRTRFWSSIDRRRAAAIMTTRCLRSLCRRVNNISQLDDLSRGKTGSALLVYHNGTRLGLRMGERRISSVSNILLVGYSSS